MNTSSTSFRLLCILAAAAFSLPVCAGTTLFYNGRVRILDAKDTVADWIAVQDGRVAGYGVGRRFETFAEAEKVDLVGRTILPGLTDAAVGVVRAGLELSWIDLASTRSPQEAADRVKGGLAGLPVGRAVVGRGWDQSRWGADKLPSRLTLDRVASDRPIILWRIDGHAAWANTAALKAAGFWAKDAPDPAGGRIQRDRDGLPTGVLLDAAAREAAKLIPEPGDADRREAIARVAEKALSLGITTIHNSSASLRDVELTRELLRAGKVRARFYEMISVKNEPDLAKVFRRGIEVDAENGLLTVRTVKLFADGAMGSRGALFEEPYFDDPSTHGIEITAPALLAKQVTQANAAGFQVAVHAIGSLANKRVLDTLEAVLGNQIAAKRPRIEHAQVLTAEEIARMGRLGVVASMQPAQCTSDMHWVVARIGAARAKHSYAWRSLADVGVRIAFGSDAPVESLSPWEGIYAAATRQTADGRPAGGFQPEQRLTLFEAARAYTYGGAYAAFAEKERGTLETGRIADLVILDEDPFQHGPAEVRDARVVATYVAGEKAWAAPVRLAKPQRR